MRIHPLTASTCRVLIFEMSRLRVATKNYRVARGVRPGDIVDPFALGLAQATPGFTMPITLPHHDRKRLEAAGSGPKTM